MTTPSVDKRLSNLLAVVALHVDGQVQANAEDAAGLGSAGSAALVALAEFADGGSIERLRDVIGLTHSGCVRLVDRLARDGFVERRPGDDKRAVAVVLTRRGRGAARRIAAARVRAVESLIADLDGDDRQHLLELCGHMLRTATSERLAARATNVPPPGGWLCRMCDFAACGRDVGLCPVATTAAQAATS